MESLVSTDWLAQHLGEPDLTIVDSSWHMPASGRSGREEYLETHIPGARFLDIDEHSDRSHPAPHMLPSAEEFGAAMEKLGIGRDDRIVVYDNSPIRTAARGWFTLRHFGARNVAILDGGFQKWLAEGRPVESGEPQPRQAKFDAEAAGGAVFTKEQILAGPGCALADARGKGRFEATEPEPRAGIAGGHIPGARNLPFGALYDEQGCFKPRAELRRLSEEALQSGRHVQVTRRDPPPLRRRGARPGGAVHRQLRFGRDGDEPDLRREPAGCGFGAALRWKLD